MNVVSKNLGLIAVATALLLSGSTQVFAADTDVPMDIEIKAYYGDKLLDRVVVVDVNNMTLDGEIYTIGEDPYPVDQAGNLEKVYAVTRGSDSMDIIDANTYEHLGLVEMEHHPRSAEAFNAYLGLQLVTGADKPMASLIDVETDMVVATVGDDTEFDPNGDYGGSNATGHPFWLTDNRFIVIDRPNRKVTVYHVRQNKEGRWITRELSSVDTPTTVHHFLQAGKNNTFFALAEGSVIENYSPLVIKYKLGRRELVEQSRVYLAEENIEDMGAHHANMHPDGIHMFVPSAEGTMFVLNIDTMEIEATISVGLGAGHTTFVADRNLAVVTNHNDTYVSIIDTINYTLIKNVEVSGQQKHGEILQSHTSFLHPDMNYFYAFATDNGIFYELDLNELEVTRTLKTHGTPLQGVYLCDGQSCSGMM